MIHIQVMMINMDHMMINGNGNMYGSVAEFGIGT